MQILILKEACDVKLQDLDFDSGVVPHLPIPSPAYTAPPAASSAPALPPAGLRYSCDCVPDGDKLVVYWKIDNFLAFKDILETRKLFSRCAALLSHVTDHCCLVFCRMC